MDSKQIYATLGFSFADHAGNDLEVIAPRDGAIIASLRCSTPIVTTAAIQQGHAASNVWRLVPAPVRGELVRLLGEVLREEREQLGRLVSLEAGKILSEGIGEVQEMIDICDFAVGLSRQLHGLTIASERPGHRMMEAWHPLGLCGVITAFNFPVAVWAWNAALAIVCGNAVIWKPSEKTPLCALAVHGLLTKAVSRFAVRYPQYVSDGLCQVVIGSADVGKAIAASPVVALVSATGSVGMGRQVATTVANRLGRSLLELGGNNAMIVAPTADLDLAVRAIVFSAVGTTGQRCTSLRRLFVHTSLYEILVARLEKLYAGLQVDDPFVKGTLVGPLIDQLAFDAMQVALKQAGTEGGQVSGGERIVPTAFIGSETTSARAYYVRPALVRMLAQTSVMYVETFAPILYVVRYDTLDEAIALNNAVSQGLSSAILTNDLREAEIFMSASGSDCGLANVNIGTSGAEIGGAFGGEKDTGGGRESGSDAWKNYMRRATNTINFSGQLPLSQGVQFDVS